MATTRKSFVRRVKYKQTKTKGKKSAEQPHVNNRKKSRLVG